MELGLTCARCDARGRVEWSSQPGALEAALAATDAFQQALQRQWSRLVHAPPEPVELTTGIYLLVLPAPRRRGGFGRQGTAEQIDVAIVPTTELADHPDLAGWVADTRPRGGNGDHRLPIPGNGRPPPPEAGPGGLHTRRDVDRFARMVAWMHEDGAEIDRRCHEVRAVSQQLLESYEELSLLYKFSARMTVDQPRARFLGEAAAELHQVLGLSWLTLQLADDEPRLGSLAGYIHTVGSADCPEAVMERIGRDLLARQFGATGPQVLESRTIEGAPQLQRLTQQVLAVSIRVGERTVGLIFAGDKTDGSPMSNLDATLCSSLASSMSIFIENVMLYEDVQSMFMGTLHALTASIDAKDSYTHGHSQRVAMLGRDLARACGLDAATADRIYLAGLVHDVGKIGVPEAVLSKPGPLSGEEFELIKRHPEIGARILGDIPQMRDLIPGVLHHHERWDGRGYPHGLRGADIPLYGRLLGLADAFDAMSSNRAYRRAIDCEAVLEEVAACAGRQFDPDLARIFTGMDFTTYYKLLQSHHANAPLRRTA